MQDREFHRAAMLLPLMKGEEYERLKADIAANGQIEPIWLHPDGSILDGRNRYIACRDLGIEPRFRQWEGGSEVEAVLFVKSVNMNRRHLTSSQYAASAVLAQELIAVLEEEARRRQGQRLDPDLPQQIAEGSPGEVREQLADLFGTNRQYISDAKRLAAEEPELFQAVRDGDLSIPQARRLARQAERAAERRETAAGADITLHCADALEAIATLDDGAVALVITDPPYGTTDHAWDFHGTEREYLGWLAGWLAALRPKLAAEYHFFLFCDPDYAARVEAVLAATGYPLKSRLVWEYRNLPSGRDVSDRFIGNWQMVFHCGTRPLDFPAEWDDRRFAVQNHARPQSNFDEGSHHPTPKPVSLLEIFVTFGSRPGELVLDCFAGGGSTGAAVAAVGGRRCVLVEREPAFCRAIEERLGVTARGL